MNGPLSAPFIAPYGPDDREVASVFGRAPESPAHVILDISRLVLACRRATPSGIDRVEMAYARRFLFDTKPAALPVIEAVWGRFTAVPLALARAYVEALGTGWLGDGGAVARARRLALRLHAGAVLWRGRRALRIALAQRPAPVFLLVSHRSLDRAASIEALTRAGAHFVPLVHDLIPLTHPEYARPRQIGRHARRVASVARLASAVLVSSQATAETLASHLDRSAPAASRVAVAPLGIGAPTVRRHPASAIARARFVALGTIEPRKNHLLLLHLWRDMAARLGTAAPQLVLIGRRGWENENIVDLLDRGTGWRSLVQELGGLSDAAVARELATATALLFPSFAEGYGLPLAEALAAGVPAICSDLPALREIGGDVPDYLDPLDGPGWRAAILDHARPDSPLRRAQQARMSAWRPPTWAAHFAIVDRLLPTLCPAPERIGRYAA